MTFSDALSVGPPTDLNGVITYFVTVLIVRPYSAAGQLNSAAAIMAGQFAANNNVWFDANRKSSLLIESAEYWRH